MTAFSTSVCTIIVGTRAPRTSSSSADVDLEPRAEPGALDLEVGADELELVVEQRPLALGAAQRVAEYVRELLDRAVGDGRILVDQAGNRVERVEQEVRVDLCPQRLQLRAARVERQLARPLILFLPLPLQTMVVDDRGEDVGERGEERHVFAEVRRLARPCAEQDPAGRGVAWAHVHFLDDHKGRRSLRR